MHNKYISDLFAILLSNIFTAFAGNVITNLSLDGITLLFWDCLTLLLRNLFTLWSLYLSNEKYHIYAPYFCAFECCKIFVKFILFHRFLLVSIFVLEHLGIVLFLLGHILSMVLSRIFVLEHCCSFFLESENYIRICSYILR